MRHFLISALLLGLVAGCSSVNLGPHRIDVQQGNALDQENVARLKPGLNRSQVRFLMGTPLVVDPFRTDRWDYVYVYYKAGKLAEQKRITLIFEGDTLARIEGNLPEPAAQAPVPAVKTEPKAQTPALPVVAETKPAPVAKTESVAATVPKAEPTAAALPVAVKAPASAPVASRPVAAPAVEPVAQAKKPVVSPGHITAAPATSIVAPLPSPKGAPAYVDPRPRAELSLQPETNIAQIQPDVIPPFPVPKAASTPSDEAILKALNDWAQAWGRRDEAAYLDAYDVNFVPQGGGSRADWEKRRRLLLGVAKNISIKIDSPSVDRDEEGAATVTFNQHYQSDNHRDAVVKQLRMAERDGRWLILEEKILSTLRGARK